MKTKGNITSTWINLITTVRQQSLSVLTSQICPLTWLKLQFALINHEWVH